eukprot:scaffold38769_cov35-Tisochrysis_lutea.AAC.3
MWKRGGWRGEREDGRDAMGCDVATLQPQEKRVFEYLDQRSRGGGCEGGTRIERRGERGERGAVGDGKGQKKHERWLFYCRGRRSQPGRPQRAAAPRTDGNHTSSLGSRTWDWCQVRAGEGLNVWHSVNKSPPTLRNLSCGGFSTAAECCGDPR